MNCKKCGRGEAEGMLRFYSTFRDGIGRQAIHVTCPEKVCKERTKANHAKQPPDICSRDGVEKTPEGKWLCRRHLAFYRQNVKRAEVMEAQLKTSQANHGRAKRAIEILVELGITGQPVYSTVKHGYTGAIVVDDPVMILRALGIPWEIETVEAAGPADG